VTVNRLILDTNYRIVPVDHLSTRYITHFSC